MTQNETSKVILVTLVGINLPKHKVVHHQKMDGTNHRSNKRNNQHNQIVISQTLGQHNRKSAQIGVRPNQILEQTGLNIHISNNHQHRFVGFEFEINWNGFRY